MISPKIATWAGSVKDASEETLFTLGIFTPGPHRAVNPQVLGRAIICLPGDARRQIEMEKEWEQWGAQPGYQRRTEKASGWVREGERKSSHVVRGPE